MDREGEDLSVVDLGTIVWAHRWAALVPFVLVVAGAGAFTAMQEPEFQAEATVLVTWDQPTHISILTSRSYAEEVLNRLAEPAIVAQLNEAGPEQPASKTLADNHVTIRPASQGDPVAPDSVLVIAVTWTDPTTAAQIAQAYVDNLAEWRPFFENLIISNSWADFFNDQSGRAATLEEFKQQVGELVNRTVFYQALDPAVGDPDPVSPSWMFNLSLAIAIGGMVGIVVPFVVEAIRRGRGAQADRPGPE